MMLDYLSTVGKHILGQWKKFEVGRIKKESITILIILDYITF